MSEGAPRITVVIPCLNEADAIGSVVDEAHAGIAGAELDGEVIVVDNASSDASAEVARAHGARVVHESRRGYGSAYLTGLEAARGDFVVMADGDGTYDLTKLAPFIRSLQAGHDVVLGSRFAGAIAAGAMPWLHRRVGNPLLTKVLNVFFDISVGDAHCGLRAVRRDAISTLRLTSTGMEFASEMILKAARAKLRIAEVPIDYRARVGSSKLRTFRDGWRHLRLLLLYSPTYLFLVPGLTLVAVGLVVFVPLALGPIRLFGREWGIHSMIAGATAILVGFQAMLVGLFARTYAVLYMNDHEPQLQRLWSRIRLEHGLIGGILLLIAGLGVLGWIVVDWARGGFENLERGHEALVGMTLVGLGTQTIFGSFFLSILGLRERTPDARRRIMNE